MKDHTNIYMILDRSGSMFTCCDDTNGNVNQFIRDQKAAGDNATLYLCTFDSRSIDVMVDHQPIKDVKECEWIVPRGTTPLYDAMGKTVFDAGKHLSDMLEADRPDKVVIVTVTDGCENCSREYNAGTLGELIKRQQDKYNWEFIYLGANQDAILSAGVIGITRDTALTFDINNPQKSALAFASTSANLTAYRGTGDRDVLSYTSEERDEAE